MPRFRVLRGVHNEGGKTYTKGDVVDSKVDLVKLHNSPGSTKFQPVADFGNLREFEVNEESGRSKDELESFTVAQLKEIARDEEVEIDASMKKEELIAALLVEV